MKTLTECSDIYEDLVIMLPVTLIRRSLGPATIVNLPLLLFYYTEISPVCTANRPFRINTTKYSSRERQWSVFWTNKRAAI